MTQTVEWIAVDWGTSTLRAWLMGPGDAVLDARRSDAGMGGLDRAGFEPALLDLIGDALGDGPVDVLACGMLGARQGWTEAPYRTVPCAPPTLAEGVQASTCDPRIRVTILPGIRQTSPADVMRGEETQIAGFLSRNPRFDGVICLPGTHAKWAHVSAGEVVSFRTAMTGELFDLLAHRSVLRHSVGEGWEQDAFDEAVSEALARPERLASALFGIRAEALIAGLSPACATARLSGLLIGAELASMRPYWLGQPVALVGSQEICDRYAAALEKQAVPVSRADGGEMTLAGLCAARTNDKAGRAA